MCDLVGIYDTNGERAVSPPAFHRINGNQHRRGTDDGRLHLEPGRVPAAKGFRQSFQSYVATPLKPLKAMAHAA